MSLPMVRRSELVCPAHSLKMMAKAAASAADEVIFDLEDACAVSQKVQARGTVAEALNTLTFASKVRAVRVNGLRTSYFYRDVTSVMERAAKNLDCLVLPKVDSAEEVRFADRLLGMLEGEAGLQRGAVRLELMIETAKGLLHAEEIAAASPRASSLIFGIADYAADIGAKDIGEAQFELFHYAKSRLIAAARASGIDVIDNVTVHFRDLARVAQDAQMGAKMGFDGKWAIHPTHIQPIHDAYTPTRSELERALALTAAYARADVAEGQGAIVYQDEMVDAATLKIEAKRIAVAQRAGLLDAQGRWVG